MTSLARQTTAQLDADDSYTALISAGCDSELNDQEALKLLDLCENDTYFQQWHLYHMIGDAMSHTPVSGTTLSQRVAEQLRHEPTIIAPKPLRTTSQRLMPIAASFAVIGALSWGVLNASFSNHIPSTFASVDHPMHAIQLAQMDTQQLANLEAAHSDFIVASNTAGIDTVPTSAAEPNP